MKIKHLATLLIGVMMIGTVGCEYVTIEPKDVVIPDTPVDFATEIAPIFTSLDCVSCHNGSFMFSLAVDKAYNSLISRNLVDTANPAGSKLIEYINAGHNTAVNMTGEQKALILKWITEGAKGEIVPVSYKDEVEPLWQSAKYNCTLCHGGSQAPDLRTGKSYASMTSTGAVVAKNLTCPLMVKINTKHNGAADMTQTEKDLVSTWILQGALNN